MTAATSEPITRRKLSDEVFDRLKAMIVSGEIATGASLPSERELMVRFGVGRPAIREAMQSLASLGLVSISHGERARVREITPQSAMRQVDTIAQLLLSTSPDSLAHLKEARTFFEHGMVRRAAELATDTDIADLRALWDRQNAAQGDATAFIHADMAFHTRLAAIGGNPIYPAISEMILGWLKEYHTHMLIWEGRGDQTLAEHERIIARVAAHDPEGAEKAMIGHLERSDHLYAHSEAGGA